MVKIFALPANEGDFIWVAYGENEVYSHILIDGGTDECGEEFASIISIIDERKEKIEALVLTHVDYDHIQGALEGICRISNDILDRTVKRIYFNTYQGIHRNLKGTGEILESSVCIEDQIRVNQNYKEYGVKDGIKFGELLSEKGLKDRLVDYVVYGQQAVLPNGATMRFISPGEKELIKFANEWEKYERENEYVQYASNLEMVKKNLADLMQEKLLSDSSPNNASSIAFIFEYHSIKLAFLGDAKPSVCLQGIKKINDADHFEVDLLKLSHHGSRSNTSDSLLKTIRTNNYLLSTNGHHKKVPSIISEECNDVLANLNDLRGYDRVISKKDMDCINEKREELMKISKELNGQKKDNLEDSQKFDVIVSDILNILKKGEYAL